MTADEQPELTAREHEILQLLVQGYRTSEIAKRLQLDYKTVAEACKNIKTKLQVDSIDGLAAWLEQNRPPSNR